MTDATERESMGRIVLRPIASPLALGFLALGGATTVLSGLQLGWYGLSESSTVEHEAGVREQL